MNNVPKVHLGIVAVSRDCFPGALSRGRREAVANACREAGIEITQIQTVVENEQDAMAALGQAKEQGVNALVIYLGNFGPETPETILAQRFDGPVMFVAAAEETQDKLINDRGDAYCGMLNASYSLALRGIRAYISEYPVGTADEIAVMIADFTVIARVLIGLKKLKIFGFGPRPQDFIACNAPIAPLYDLGIEIQENSELDLFASFHAHEGDARIDAIMQDMKRELGEGNYYPDLLQKLAQYELTLLDWYRDNLGASEFGVFAGKCWPAFQTQFGFVPCYVNSRFASRMMPIACEVDLYGALSEYLLACVTEAPVTLLDINNSVPASLYEAKIKGATPYALSDLFIGFHCGNTPAAMLASGEMSYQLIMKRLLEPDSEPNVSRGTLEGNMKAGGVTLLRIQPTMEGGLQAYIAQGEVLNVAADTFGARGIFGIPEMGRFYRHVMLRGGFPHHAGIGYGAVGSPLWSILELLGITEVGFNQPKGMLYKTENPFA